MTVWKDEYVVFPNNTVRLDWDGSPMDNLYYSQGANVTDWGPVEFACLFLATVMGLLLPLLYEVEN